MITSNANGEILVEANEKSYNLSVSEEYSDFLLWVTSPTSKVSIDEKVFQVSNNLTEDEKKKAERYAEFLIDFAKRRVAKLAELDQSLTTEQRESEITAFINRLNPPSKG